MSELQQQVQKIITVPRMLIDRMLALLYSIPNNEDKRLYGAQLCEACMTNCAAIRVPYVDVYSCSGFLNICDVCSRRRHQIGVVRDPVSIVIGHSKRLAAARHQLRTAIAAIVTRMRPRCARIYRCAYCSKLDAMMFTYSGYDNVLYTMNLCEGCYCDAANVSRDISR